MQTSPRRSARVVNAATSDPASGSASETARAGRCREASARPGELLGNQNQLEHTEPTPTVFRGDRDLRQPLLPRPDDQFVRVPLFLVVRVGDRLDARLREPACPILEFPLLFQQRETRPAMPSRSTPSHTTPSLSFLVVQLVIAARLTLTTLEASAASGHPEQRTVRSQYR